MKKISGVIIAKNAQDVIVDALESLEFCDEILVIDNNSEDNTRKICEKYGARVIPVTSGSFAEIRNEGLKKASGDWILYIDADERVSLELKKSILSVVNNRDSGVFKLKRKNFYLGNNEWPHIEKLERLFSKDALSMWYGELHESPRFKGEVDELNGFLFHFTHKNLSQMLEKTIEWSKIEAELRLNDNHPRMTWWRFPRVMIYSFVKSYILEGGWKIGTVGLIESIYQSFSMFITYARLWEIQNNEKQK